MNLINKDLSINLILFEYNEGIWKVIGTEVTGNGMMNCIDGIKNIKTHEIKELNRIELFNLQNKGKIKPYNERSISERINTPKTKNNSIQTLKIDLK